MLWVRNKDKIRENQEVTENVRGGSGCVLDGGNEGRKEGNFGVDGSGSCGRENGNSNSGGGNYCVEGCEIGDIVRANNIECENNNAIKNRIDVIKGELTNININDNYIKDERKSPNDSLNDKYNFQNN